jgi:ribosomal protein S7
MKLITQAKIDYTLERQEAVKKLISQLEANGKKKEAKEKVVRQACGQGRRRPEPRPA